MEVSGCRCVSYSDFERNSKGEIERDSEEEGVKGLLAFDGQQYGAI